SGTPSQLISRRTPPNEPFAPAVVPPPMAARKLSRTGVISATFRPVPENNVIDVASAVETAIIETMVAIMAIFFMSCLRLSEVSARIGRVLFLPYIQSSRRADLKRDDLGQGSKRLARFNEIRASMFHKSKIKAA